MKRPCHDPDDVPRRLAPTTVHPASWSRSAQARPMPADAPVIKTTSAMIPRSTGASVAARRAPELPPGPARGMRQCRFSERLQLRHLDAGPLGQLILAAL